MDYNIYVINFVSFSCPCSQRFEKGLRDRMHNLASAILFSARSNMRPEVEKMLKLDNSAIEYVIKPYLKEFDDNTPTAAGKFPTNFQYMCTSFPRFTYILLFPRGGELTNSLLYVNFIKSKLKVVDKDSIEKKRKQNQFVSVFYVQSYLELINFHVIIFQILNGFHTRTLNFQIFGLSLSLTSEIMRKRRQRLFRLTSYVS
jgi:hypothetical protein